MMSRTTELGCALPPLETYGPDDMISIVSTGLGLIYAWSHETHVSAGQ